MASVHIAVAEDDQYRMQVASKLTWPVQETDEMPRRFRQERQILANLDPPTSRGCSTEEPKDVAILTNGSDRSADPAAL